MLHCGGDGWNESIGKERMVDYRFLAKTTGPSISILITDIVFLTEMQKRANPSKWICPLSEEEYNHGGLTTLKYILMSSKLHHTQINHIDIIKTKCIIIMLSKLPSDSKFSGYHPDFRLTEL